TKDPRYRDVLYVEELVGADTVNTIPPATWDAFRDHGKLRASLEEDLDGARRTLAALERADISLDDVTAKLLDDALRLFEEPFRKLLATIETRAAGAAIEATLEEWRGAGKVRRLWAKDATVFTGRDEGRWLGWLDVVAERSKNGGELAAFAEEMR